MSRPSPPNLDPGFGAPQTVGRFSPRKPWPAPFVLAAVLALLTATPPLAEIEHVPMLVAAALLTLVLLAVGRASNRAEAPPWTRAVAPLGYFAVVVLLRGAAGGAVSGFGPLVLLPVVWLALYGTRRELVVAVGLVAATFTLPVLLGGGSAYPVSEWRRALMWVMVAPLVGFAIQRLVHEVEARASESAERAAALARSEARLEGAFAEASVGMAYIALDGGFQRVNDALCGLLGRPRHELLELALTDVSHPEDRAVLREESARLARGEVRSHAAEHRCPRPDGAVACALLTLTVVSEPDGTPVHLMAQFQDVTERKHFEAQLRHLADHDPLTGLVNRRRFEEDLQHAIVTAGRYPHPAALLVVDLDEFKQVNDSFGHAAGDEVLARVAGLMKGRLRDSDVLGRIGGDEFAVILPRAELSDAWVVAKDLIDAVGSEAVAGARGRRLRATASIGIRAFGPGTGAASAELLAQADAAMYAAKGCGRDRVAVAGEPSTGEPPPDPDTDVGPVQLVTPR